MERIDSCHSVWLFDTELRRFRRVPRGLDVDAPSLEADWEPYHGLEIDAESGSFAVALNEGGTRLLRSWRHTQPCPYCGADTHVTAEVRLTHSERT